MAIIRVEKRSNFTVVDNTFIRDKNLSLKAKGLMLCMLSLPPEWDFSVAGLVKAIKTDRRDALMKSLAVIESEGYLTRTRERDSNGKVRAAIWTVSDTPIKKINSFQPKSDLPTLATPTLVKPQQYNTPTEYNNVSNTTSCGEIHKNAYSAVKWLDRQIREYTPEWPKLTDKDLHTGAKAIQDLYDQYQDWQLLSDVLIWVQDNDFWKSKIIDGQTFKKHFKKLLARFRGECDKEDGKWKDFV